MDSSKVSLLEQVPEALGCLLGGCGRLVLALALLSPWMLAEAVGDLLLFAGRRWTIRWGYAAPRGQCWDQELGLYRRGGLLLSLLGICYLLIFLLEPARCGTPSEGQQLLAMALSGGRLILALRGILRFRRAVPEQGLRRLLVFLDAAAAWIVAQGSLLWLLGWDAENVVRLFGMVFAAGTVMTGFHMRYKKPLCWSRAMKDHLHPGPAFPEGPEVLRYSCPGDP